MLITTGAMCNQCAATTQEKTDVEEEGVQEEETGEEAQEEESAQEEETPKEGSTKEESQEEEEDAEEEGGGAEEEETQTAYEEPTIELQVYEGPVYSQADDVCYWRVKAIVTGVPTPTVEFNRDDSNGAWGSKKVQVNLASPTDSYSLQATATNTEGTAIDSIVLAWECNRPPEVIDIVMMGDHFVGKEYTISANAADPDGDTMNYSWSVNGGSLNSSSGNPIKWTMPATEGDYQITVEADDGNGGTDQRKETVVVIEFLAPPITLPIVSSEGGWITSDGDVTTGNFHLVGDSHNNFALRGFVSFDITGLSGATVETAELTVNRDNVSGSLSSFLPLWLVSVNWEPGSSVITASDYNLTGDIIYTFGIHSFFLSSQVMKGRLQDAINAGRNRFQIMLYFQGRDTDNDNSYDYWGYIDSKIKFNVSYTQ